MPKHLKISILRPLCKNPKKPKYLTGNLRPIAISDPLTNVFEKILKIVQIKKLFKCDSLQFSFKSKSSCKHAIFALNECINKALRDSFTLFLIAIDASKAFDKINRWYYTI